MILFQIIQKPQKRGAEIFAAQLSEHLEKLGHTVILISLFEGVSELPFSGKKIQLNRPISKRWYDYEAWQQIARLVKEFKPDIIQCNAGDTLKFMILSKLFFGWKVPVIELTMSIVVPFGISLTENVAVEALRVPVDFTKTIPRGLVKK